MNVQRLNEIRSRLMERGGTLVAVSKTFPVQSILEVYHQGQRAFGENRVQELLDKYEKLPRDIEWHMIGHLQTNKVRQIVPFVHMIHSVDSFRLLREIDNQAAKVGRVVNCLLQIHIASEETKYGFDEQEVVNMLENPEFARLQHVKICGVMGMATFTDDIEQVRREFRHLKSIYSRLKTSFFQEDPGFREISMGMSGDWEPALEEGSTMVRVGSLIFGERTSSR